jgi:MFS family permease
MGTSAESSTAAPENTLFPDQKSRSAAFVAIGVVGRLAPAGELMQARRRDGLQKGHGRMLKVLAHSWPLLTGVMLLMVGNGIQGTLLGIRGNIEGFSTYQLSYVMAAYFLGFLFGSWAAPRMIRRVGHIRVFAALGSLISAILVIYPVYPDWIVWTALRVLAGFCFSGIYITAESWINNTASNETRGQALSAYMIVQMIGIVASQVLLNLPDPTGFALFILPSVLVSLAFMPILLAPTPAPAFDSSRRVSFARLFSISPLGCVGMLLTGGVFSAMFGMASVWGSQEGLTVGQISIFVGAMYVGGLVLQYPIGLASDRMDRRKLIMGLSAVAAVAMLVAGLLPLPFWALVGMAMILGGITNPVYSLLIAYTNDFLPREQMAGASAGLIFLNGFGAIFGPTATGWMMETFGPSGFFLFIGGLFLSLAGYAVYRMTRRAAPTVTGAFRGVTPGASPLAVEAVLEKAAKP